MPHIRLDCLHYDTCLPSYFGGCYAPHIQIAVHRGMTLAQIKSDLKSELNEGLVGGCDSIVERHGWKVAAVAAVNRITPNIKNQRRFFMDIEEGDEYCESIYAYFIFSDT